MVPFENSTNGSVVPTLDCFADRGGAYPDLSVCAEIYLDVHHCLVGRRYPLKPSSSQTQPEAPPQNNSGPEAEAEAEAEAEEVDLSHIKRIYSHPQAFGQCTLFLSAKLRGVETVDVSSTSRAAEMVYRECESTSAPAAPCESAAISSAVAARALGLDVLARNIEDRADNTTRFFVLRRGGGTGQEHGGDTVDVDIEELLCRTRAPGTGTRAGPGGGSATTATAGSTRTKSKKTKSLVSFTVPHRSPGALADVLDAFRRSGLNLTSISSRPRNGPGPAPAPTPAGNDGGDGDGGVSSFQYVFFVEFEGHRYRDPDGRVRDALAGVAASARAWRWLGSWEDMLCERVGRASEPAGKGE